MRLVVLASPTPPLFDRAASLQLLQQVGYRGVAVGILFVAIRRWLPKWKMGVGVEFGGLLVIGTVAAALLSPWKSEFRQGPLLVGLVLFALLVLGFGIATAWMTAGLERGVARAGDGVVQSLAVSVVAVLGLMMSVLGWVSIIVKDLISS